MVAVLAVATLIPEMAVAISMAVVAIDNRSLLLAVMVIILAVSSGLYITPLSELLPLSLSPLRSSTSATLATLVTLATLAMLATIYGIVVNLHSSRYMYTATGGNFTRSVYLTPHVYSSEMHPSRGELEKEQPKSHASTTLTPGFLSFRAWHRQVTCKLLHI